MPQELFHLVPAGHANVIELELPEMLDSAEFDELNESILALVQDGAPAPSAASGSWVIDLSRVSYMGSAMLGLMVNLRQRIRAAGGQLVLCSMPPTLLQIFRTCCMERLFDIAKSRGDALRMTR
jgi:anti-anti-sigma factor